ncbi:MAG: leucine-rich repeat domain-containing protein [Candidatus Goldbacteria bacterium]|nr:leucine-rich repeat domain-containing protein [Candidatus Goldiibacteriota bacterium]
MKRFILIFFLILNLILFFSCSKNETPQSPPQSTCEKVTFPDANLETAIRVALNKPTGDICKNDCEKVSSLIQCLNSKNITSIQGMQYFKNLQELEMYDNQISDISPLSGLTKLRYLNLSNNKISDISALSGLTDLYSLNLANNQISNITSLSSLTNLIYLTLSNNTISDITSLSDLLKLQELYLSNNLIEDIAALVTNCDAGGLGSGDTVYLEGNPVATGTPGPNITYLENKGVIVNY